MHCVGASGFGCTIREQNFSCANGFVVVPGDGCDVRLVAEPVGSDVITAG